MTALREIYDRQIARRGYKPDPVQLAVVQRLDELREQLIAAHSRSGLRRWLPPTYGQRETPQRMLGKLFRGETHSPRGIYLWGGVGRGKTWLMDLFFQSLPFKQRRRRHFHRFMHDVHAQLKTLSDRVSPLEEVAERIARESRVLCFDELFVSDIADAMILGNLFDGLFRRGVTLVVTSNVPPRDLYRNGLQRQRFVPAIELIEAHMQILEVAGPVDYRLRQLSQAGTYLESQAPQTRARLEALFREMSDDEDGHGGTVEIEGRNIPVVRAGENVVWLEFEAACEGPRSVVDYIELARDYQSLIVSNVPVLDATRENAARRFIALVDELYDRNVNLIVSAAAPPRELYRGDRLQQEFQRTVSRLTEMQSEEYLKKEHRG